jgi:ribosomal protein S4
MYLFRSLRNRISKSYGRDLFGNYIYNSKKRLKFLRKMRPRRKFSERKNPIMRVDVVEPGKKRRKMTSYYYMLRLKHRMRMYYGTIKEEQFRKVLNITHSARGFFVNNIFSLFEARIDSILYRSNFIKTLPLGKQLILHGYVYVNGIVSTKYSNYIKPGDIVSMRYDYKRRFLKQVLFKVKRRGYVCHHPTYLEINYKILSIIFIGNFSISQVSYPFEMSAIELLSQRNFLIK